MRATWDIGQCLELKEDEQHQWHGSLKSGSKGYLEVSRRRYPGTSPFLSQPSDDIAPTSCLSYTFPSKCKCYRASVF